MNRTLISLGGDVNIFILGRQRHARYMRERPPEARPSHQYDTGTADQIATERILFRRYSEYFKVADEV